MWTSPHGFEKSTGTWKGGSQSWSRTLGRREKRAPILHRGTRANLYQCHRLLTENSPLSIFAVNGTSRPYFAPDRGKVTGTHHAHKRALRAHFASETRSLD